MKAVWKEIKYWSQLFLIPVYFLSFLIPRDKKIWVLGSTFGHRFADNPKFFYLYLKEYRANEIRAIWISRNADVIKLLHENNLEGYHLNSPKGIWYSLRAKVYLYDNYSKDICYTLSGGALRVNLWHGIPLKKIQMDNIFDYVRHPRTKWEHLKWKLRRMSDEKPSDYILTTSEFLKPIFSSAFQTKNVLITGYPRNDCIISDKIKVILTEEEKRLLKRIEDSKQNKKIAFYMPTFRESETKFFDIIDNEKFEFFLERENILFLIKLHPKSKLNTEFMKLKASNIIVIDQKQDPYLFLKHTDVLITDYSSIYFDFLLTDKPIIFFSYDLKEYISNSREMYFDYDIFAPGPKVKTQVELETELLAEDKYYKERNEIKHKVFDMTDEYFGCEKLYENIRDLLG